MGELGAYKRELAALRRARMGAKYLEAAAAEMDLTVLLGSSNKMSESNNWIRRVVGQGRVDELVLQPSDDITESAMSEILRRRMPLVLMNSYTDGDVSTVTIDD